MAGEEGLNDDRSSPLPSEGTTNSGQDLLKVDDWSLLINAVVHSVVLAHQFQGRRNLYYPWVIEMTRTQEMVMIRMAKCAT